MNRALAGDQQVARVGRDQHLADADGLALDRQLYRQPAGVGQPFGHTGAEALGDMLHYQHSRPQIARQVGQQLIDYARAAGAGADHDQGNIRLRRDRETGRPGDGRREIWRSTLSPCLLVSLSALSMSAGNAAVR